MSQSTAVRAAARPGVRNRPRPKPERSRLRVVGTPAYARSRAGLVLGCLGLLAGGLIGLLLLNVNLERGAYQLRSEQAEAARLQEQRQALQEQIAALQAPQNLAAAAEELGMVRNPNAAFIRSPDGKVLGVPQQAATPPTPSVTKAVVKKPRATKQPTADRATPVKEPRATASPTPVPTGSR